MERQNRNRLLAGYLLSLIAHIAVFAGPGLLLELNTEPIPPGSVTLDFRHFQPVPEEVNEIEEIEEESPPVEEIEEEEPVIEEEEKPDSTGMIAAEEDTLMNEFLTALAEADTASLDTLYQESTLDVSIKFSQGWTYLDENAKGKLDAVTFFLPGSGDAMPFVHLEVRDKDLFNSQKYEHMQEMRHYTAYFNDPEELEGQFSLEVYMRTETGEDYLLKLTVRGEEAFNRYRPVFYAMLKTFSFGDDIL